jgi:hypothetical protein
LIRIKYTSLQKTDLWGVSFFKKIHTIKINSKKETLGASRQLGCIIILLRIYHENHSVNNINIYKKISIKIDYQISVINSHSSIDFIKALYIVDKNKKNKKW